MPETSHPRAAGRSKAKLVWGVLILLALGTVGAWFAGSGSRSTQGARNPFVPEPAPSGSPAAGSRPSLSCPGGLESVGRFAEQATHWNSFLDELSSRAPISAIDEINRYREAHGFPLRIPRPSTETQADLVSKFPDRLDALSGTEGTGPGSVLFVRSLGAPLVTHHVVELDPSTHRELRRWPVELDRAPEAVSGDRLFYRRSASSLCVPDERSRSFSAWISIDTSGAFVLLEPTEEREVPPADEKILLLNTCPGTPRFSDPGQVVCAQLRDRKSRRKRLLLWRSTEL